MAKTSTEYMREWRKNNKDRNAENARRDNMRRYGFWLEKEDYDAKVRMQDGECMICGGDNNGKTLHTDHDHKTGNVRDLLCKGCNKALGMMNDDPDRLRAAADYLEDHVKRAA